MEKVKRIIVIGGGTFNPIRNHLSLCAPAFGTTALAMHHLLPGSELYLTKMALRTSNLLSNDDVEKLIDELLKDSSVGTIILNVAFCDYIAKIGNIESGFHAERLMTKDGPQVIQITPAEKIIAKIRRQRPDIFLVGFKTTTGKTPDEQFLIALKMMKSTKCNLVLSNDVITRYNMIITPEESHYGNTVDRDQVLRELIDMLSSRLNATYHKTNFIEQESFSVEETTSNTFQTVLRWVIDNNGFISNNGNGFTPGHFCQKKSPNIFMSSQRKADHNLVFNEGISLVEVSEDDQKFTVRGRRKASVGARSQWLVLKQNPEYDCIIHTHNPLKAGSTIPVAEQKSFQCGSLECGMNTLNNLGDFGDIKAVYLDKHGPNILFKSSSKPEDVINFIKLHIQLGVKTT
jgi:hypothetical protein